MGPSIYKKGALALLRLLSSYITSISDFETTTTTTNPQEAYTTSRVFQLSTHYSSSDTQDTPVSTFDLEVFSKTSSAFKRGAKMSSNMDHDDINVVKGDYNFLPLTEERLASATTSYKPPTEKKSSQTTNTILNARKGLSRNTGKSTHKSASPYHTKHQTLSPSPEIAAGSQYNSQSRPRFPQDDFEFSSTRSPSPSTPNTSNHGRVHTCLVNSELVSPRMNYYGSAMDYDDDVGHVHFGMDEQPDSDFINPVSWGSPSPSPSFDRTSSPKPSTLNASIHGKVHTCLNGSEHVSPRTNYYGSAMDYDEDARSVYSGVDDQSDYISCRPVRWGSPPPGPTFKRTEGIDEHGERG